MGKIIVLDENTSNKIAAGEVIERPASVIKELVENSIDAGASNITVEIKNGGILYIRVSDNGSGIDEDDAALAFERHATSKIRNANDLDSISTLGFRGEALASIAAVASVELITRTNKNSHGVFTKIQGGVIKDIKQTGCPVGTTFVITDLFYNTPARFKFLKKDSTEAGYISDIISRIALSNPNISFKLLSNNTVVLHTPGNNDLKSAIFSIYGKETSKEIIEINHTDNKMEVTGYAGKPEISRTSRVYQSIFINGRYIKSRLITSAIDEAYKTFLMKGKFPFVVLNIKLNSTLIDVNVHPTKMDIRFSSEQEVFRSIYHAINNALLSRSQIRSADIKSRVENVFKFDVQPKKEYIQNNIEIENQFVKESSNHIDAKQEISMAETSKNRDVSEKLIKLTKEIKSESKVQAEAWNDKKSSDTSYTSHMPDKENLEEKKQPDEKAKLINARIIGQLFLTYILLQYEDEFIMIDQHAAHERIMYEILRDRYLSKEPMSQTLISPLAIELTNQEIKLLEEKRELFVDLGFIYEDFGNNSIILRAIPYSDSGNTIKETFLEVIDYILNAAGAEYKKLADEALYTIACKAAVKANKRLDDAEISAIQKQLSRLENPFTCPHGRPTVLKVTKHDIEKMFKRIV